MPINLSCLQRLLWNISFFPSQLFSKYSSLKWVAIQLNLFSPLDFWKIPISHHEWRRHTSILLMFLGIILFFKLLLNQDILLRFDKKHQWKSDHDYMWLHGRWRKSTHHPHNPRRYFYIYCSHSFKDLFYYYFFPTKNSDFPVFQ